VRDKVSGAEKVLHLSKEQVDSDTHLRDPTSGQDLEVLDKVGSPITESSACTGCPTWS
jgi:hypothetical protein